MKAEPGESRVNTYRSQILAPKKGKRSIAPKKMALVKARGITKVSYGYFVPSNLCGFLQNFRVKF